MDKASHNQDFLHLLRASNGDFEKQNNNEGSNNYEEQNADTLRTNNGNEKNTKTVNLTSLFEVPSSSAAVELNNVTTTERPPIPPLKTQPSASSVASKAMKTSEMPQPNKSSLRTMQRPLPISNRNRSVSFDRQVFSMTQPVLPETTTIEFTTIDQNNNTASVGHISRISELPVNSSLPGHQRISSDRVLTIDDLISSGQPYELEAETNILKVVEEQHHQQQSSHHQRYYSETSTIFSGIPDSMVYEMSTPKEEHSDYSSKQHSNDGNQHKHQARPLLQKDRNHTRTKSVSDRLVGLTLAMQLLDNAEVDHSNTVEEPISPRLNGNHVIDVASQNEASASLESIKRLASLTEDDESFVGEIQSNIDVESQKEASVDHQDSKLNHSQRPASVLTGARAMVEDSEEIWRHFFHTAGGIHVRAYIKNIGLLLLLLMSVSFILFYGTGNPRPADENQASISWYLLFFARQIVTLSLALATQLFIIDFLCVSTKILLRLLGQYVTLLVIMSKGWPFVVFMMSIFDFTLLYGDNAYAKHWGYWQSAVKIFTEENPSGDVVTSIWNHRILSIALCLSFAATLKRFIIGAYLGRQTYGHYGEKLAKVMNKMLLVREVAHLSKKINKATKSSFGTPKAPENFRSSVERLRNEGRSQDSDDEESAESSFSKSDGTYRTVDVGNLDELERLKLIQLLGRWEEPDRVASANNHAISISEVLRFRNALTFIKDDYPFSFAFGLAGSRDATIQSSQEIYSRLLSNTPDNAILQFETIAYIALQRDGVINQEKAKELIKVFRPDRAGNLTLLDFIKSIDTVYKEFRLLQASVKNSSLIDKAFEKMFNIVFYGVLVTIFLSIIGVDPLSLFLSFSSVIFAFAFMIGSASSKYFEGILFILVRRPYGIGDIIHVSDAEQETSTDGSMGWIVQSVNLFETTAIWVPTLERASFSNGSLSSSRIINWARSPNARFNIKLSFPISTKYETIEIFKRAVEEYLKVRPREWLALNGFRVQRIYTEKGYMEVILTLQHRDPWQNIGQILDSKANLVSYCHEVQKHLGMQYHAPPLPVDILNNDKTISNLIGSQALSNAESVDDQPDQNGEVNERNDDLQFQQFRRMAKHKYNIRVA